MPQAGRFVGDYYVRVKRTGACYFNRNGAVIAATAAVTPGLNLAPPTELKQSLTEECCSGWVRSSGFVAEVIRLLLLCSIFSLKLIGKKHGFSWRSCGKASSISVSRLSEWKGSEQNLARTSLALILAISVAMECFAITSSGMQARCIILSASSTRHSRL